MSRSTTGRAKGTSCDARQHRSPPERKGPVQRHERRGRLLIGGGLGQGRHLEGVDVRGVDHQTQTVVRALEHRPGVGPDPLGQGVERALRRDERTPQAGRDVLGRDGLAGRQGQQRDQGPLALAGGRLRSTVDDDLHRTQQPNEHGAQRRTAGGR